MKDEVDEMEPTLAESASNSLFLISSDFEDKFRLTREHLYLKNKKRTTLDYRRGISNQFRSSN